MQIPESHLSTIALPCEHTIRSVAGIYTPVQTCLHGSPNKSYLCSIYGDARIAILVPRRLRVYLATLDDHHGYHNRVDGSYLPLVSLRLNVSARSHLKMDRIALVLTPADTQR